MITTRWIIVVSLTVMLPIAASAQTLIDTVPVGTAPREIVVDALRNKIYVAAFDFNVGVIDGTTDQATRVHLPNIDAAAMVLNPVTNKVYATSGSGDALAIIDGATLSVITLTVGPNVSSVALDPVTNKVYLPSPFGSLTIVDGATLATTLLQIPTSPTVVGVNPVTNKVYLGDPDHSNLIILDGDTLETQTVTLPTSGVSVFGINSFTNRIYAVPDAIFGGHSIAIIDGATLAVSTVDVGMYPDSIAVDLVRNKIYVASGIGTVTVIDGQTNQTTTVNVGSSPFGIEVNAITNKIYVANSQSDNLTMIDGDSLEATTVDVGRDPVAVAVNWATNRVYASNYGDGTESVLLGGEAAPLQFVSTTPCRLVDTRQNHDPIPGGTSRSFVLPQMGGCGIPSNAPAYSLNVTVVPSRPLGYLTLWPTGVDQPLVSTLNSPDGRVKANAAIVPAGYQGAVSAYVTDTTDIILDIDGYFTAPTQQTYEFYPLAPCRVIDTRGLVGDLGGPFLHGGRNDGSHRDFPVRESQCIPANANVAAYSMNFTVVPHTSRHPLGYLTVWPQGADQPVVSTLNNPTGTVVANAAIVPSGTDGGISVFAYDDTDMIADINGYFGPAGQGGLSFHPSGSCRSYDSRINHGQPFQGTRRLNIVNSPCLPPVNAQGYVFNATVVPANGPMGYLTLWPDGQGMPLVSTLNAYDGLVTSNMAIVPNDNGSIDAYADGLTHLILDISGYFAP
jgi:YVTN family beta-propeller protein